MKDTKYQVGFGEVDITPAEPVLLCGYHYDRRSTGVHDPLCARSMAVSDGKTAVTLCVADLAQWPMETVAETRKIVRKECGLSPEQVMFSVAHSHTGPDVERETSYAASLPARLAESVRRALRNLSQARLEIASGTGPPVQFIRRYRMKDGSVRTNPGILNPEVLEPLGSVDPTLRVLLASDAGRAVGGLAHFALHCDTIGGTEISADWTHFLRQRMRDKLGAGLPLLTPIGPSGDVNHWNVFAPVSLRGFPEAERIGNAIAQSALRIAAGRLPVAAGRVAGVRREIDIHLRAPSKAELAEAQRILSQPAQPGVDFTLERVVAARHARVAAIGAGMRVDLAALAFGDVALAGVPAELFTELGRRIVSRSPFRHTLVVSMADGFISYVGARHNYEEGGFELTAAIAAPGTGEQLVDAAVEALMEAKEKQSAG